MLQLRIQVAKRSMMVAKRKLSDSDATPLPNISYKRHACHLAQALDLSSVKCLITSDEPCACLKGSGAMR